MRSALLWLVLSFFLTTSAIADTTITFQGQLDRQGSPYSGQADMTFRLFDAETGGNQIGSDQTVSVAVTSGVFTANIDFGAVFDGTSVWIETLVGSTKLGDRQRITSVPSALTANQGQGRGNTVTGTSAFVGAANLSVNNGDLSAVLGGGGHQITTDGGVANSGGGNLIGGGLGNRISGSLSAIVGGTANLVTGQNAAVLGGSGNSVSALSSAVSGGDKIQMTGQNSFAGGGGSHIISGGASGVVGGLGNRIEMGTSFMGGGLRNKLTGNDKVVSSIVGGADNQISDSLSFIGSGNNNSVSESRSAILAGSYNTVTSGNSVIVGGGESSVSGVFSSVVSGFQNTVTGALSFAAGTRAKALHNGVFIWADNVEADFTSSADGQFLVRARNGVGIGTNDSLPANGLRVAGDVIARAYFTSSSEKFKSNIQRYVPSPSLLESFEAVTYNVADSSGLHIGVIAEEVQKVAPELVSQNESGEVVGVAYDRLSIALIAALLEEVNTLKSRIEELEKDR